jgi:hypothetical protein
MENTPYQGHVFLNGIKGPYKEENRWKDDERLGLPVRVKCNNNVEKARTLMK